MCRTSQIVTKLVQVHSTRPMRALFNGKAAAMRRMLPEDLEVVCQQDVRTLAKWWCTLNSWSWPDELPYPEGTQGMRTARRSKVMRWIEAAIGIKECLREWNRSNMDDEAFKNFWRGTFEGVDEARQRFLAWLGDEQSHSTSERRLQSEEVHPSSTVAAVCRITVRHRLSATRHQRGRMNGEPWRPNGRKT